MGKLGKFLGIVLVIFLVVMAGLFAFVRFYLTEDRVKSIVIPQAETALGREVAIGDISIGLFSGITIRDFLIKETGGKTDFINAKAFVLSYELLPLLQKKLIISEIRLDEPVVRIVREKNGKFNFATLAVLSEEKKEAEKSEPGSSSALLPIALTINQIKLNQARLTIQDQLNEIPAAEATASASLSVALGRTPQDMQFGGNFDFAATATKDDIQARINGNGRLDQKDLEVVLDTDIAGEQVHVEADVKNYQQAPNANLAVRSKSLNIDKLLGVANVLPKSESAAGKRTSTPKPRSDEAMTDSLPSGLTAQGNVQVDNAIYKGLAATDFRLTFELTKGILTVKELTAKAYGGRLDSAVTVDLNKPDLAYSGKLGLQSIQASDFSSALMQNIKGMIGGSLQTAVNFSGAGTSWEQLSKVLTADGTFKMTDGYLKGTPVSLSIANLLGLQELNNIQYKDISGTFTIVEGGRAKITTNLDGDDLDAEAQGIIGLDGSLDLPLTFHLSPALAEKLQSRASFTKYLTDEQGGASLNLKLAGTVTRPKPTLDMKGVQQQLQKTIQKEIIKQLDGSGQDSGQKPTPENVIKGLFGR